MYVANISTFKYVSLYSTEPDVLIYQHFALKKTFIFLKQIIDDESVDLDTEDIVCYVQMDYWWQVN